MADEVLIVTSTEQLVQIDAPQAVVEAELVQELIELAVQGPPGPQGPPGLSGGSASAVPLGEAVGGHRAVIISDSAAFYADADNVAHAGRVAGITSQAGGAGASVLVQSSGPMTEPSWGWTPNGDIWLGLNGLLTQIPPGAAAFAQRLGYATSPTSIWVEISEPVVF